MAGKIKVRKGKETEEIPFLLGNRFERCLKDMYDGDSSIYLKITRMIEIIEILALKGKVSYITYSLIRKFLSCHILGHMIRSRHDSRIQICEILDDTDEFELEDLIDWMLYELLNDELFSLQLSGHNYYAGIIRYLNDVELSGVERVQDFNSCLDYVYCGSRYYYTIYYHGGIALFYGENPPRESILEDETCIIAEGIVDGRIYRAHDGSHIYFNSSEDIICGYHIGTGDCQYMAGKIYACLSDDRILVKKGKRSVMIKTDDPGQEIPCQDIGTGYGRNFKAKTVWNNIVRNCYQFKINTAEKMSHRLFLFKAYQPPFPMSLEKVTERIDFIERGVEDGKAEHGVDYVGLVLLMDSLEKNHDRGEDILDELALSEIASEKDSLSPDGYGPWMDAFWRTFWEQRKEEIASWERDFPGGNFSGNKYMSAALYGYPEDDIDGLSKMFDEMFEIIEPEEDE